jgi:rSAM/selenodomain-associated transferase 1
LLFYSSFIDQNDEWDEAHFQKHLQEGDELGERIKNAFEFAFRSHSKVVIIGSDCASINFEIVEEAFTALARVPFVVGPAMDGGYYLLGMDTFEPSIFKDIEWSTDKVFNQTIEAIKKLNKSCYLLPELSDIDYEEDWEEYGWKV